MKEQQPEKNFLDELSADAPMRRMHSRFEELTAEPPGPARRPGAWLAAAAVAMVVIAGVWVLELRAPGPVEMGDRARAALQLLEAPSAFERLRGVRAAAELTEARALLQPALLARLEGDDSINVRLAALEALLVRDLATPESERLIRALERQNTAIVQAHLGYQLRRRRLVSRQELAAIIELPGIQPDARKALTRLEDL